MSGSVLNGQGGWTLPGGMTAEGIASAGVNAPGAQQALAGYAAPGESYGPNGLVEFGAPPGGLPGGTPTQQALAVFGTGASAIGTTTNNAVQAVGNAANAAGTDIHNALNAANAFSKWLPWIALGIVGVAVFAVAEDL